MEHRQLGHRDCIIIGRSPFINDVDMARLKPNLFRIGLNFVSHHFDVDCNFWFDGYWAGHKPCRIYVQENLSTKIKLPSNVIKYSPKCVEYPLNHKIYTQEGNQCLGFLLFTISSAFNWALLQSPPNIYLVGIDHVETDTSFKRFQSYKEDLEPNLTPASHQLIKKFIAAGHGGATTVWQTNPAVKDDWPLPYKPIEELYVI